MTKFSTIAKLEAKYFCNIEYDSMYDCFDIYSEDGCHWACVKGYNGLRKELAESRKSLERIHESRFC